MEAVCANVHTLDSSNPTIERGALQVEIFVPGPFFTDQKKFDSKLRIRSGI